MNKKFNILKEIKSESVRIVLKITLENGIVLLYHDLEGYAEGSDGKIYYPVYIEKETDGEIEIVGWSSELEHETFLLN